VVFIKFSLFAMYLFLHLRQLVITSNKKIKLYKVANPIKIPKLGQSVESCIITQWYKKKGDNVKVGDVLFSYETDKAAFDEESKEEGVLLEIFYDEGDEVAVLTNVGVIGQPGESLDEFRDSDEVKSETQVEKDVEEEVDFEQDDEAASSPGASDFAVSSGKIKISPRAKTLAEKLGVYYNNLKGTGPENRIIERDIEEAAKSARFTPHAAQLSADSGKIPGQVGSGLGGRILEKDLIEGAEVFEDFEISKLSNIRKLIAKGMYNSLQNSAQLTHHMGADARNILSLRKNVKKLKAEGEIKADITLNDMVCFAVIKALQKNPDANAHFLGDSIKKFKSVHLAFAVDTERGLMVPVLRNADRLSLEELSSKLRELAEMAKKGSIDPDLINSEAASFTVSNLGAYGVEMFTPVINLPQVGILGVNTIVNRPVDLGNGAFGFVPYIGLSLTYDHRAIDGGPATLFLRDITIEIENFQTKL
jgi:pyruvate dehydrogenase E2 component (dihydrolipoyllysine-residue acetyltransferase)